MPVRRVPPGSRWCPQGSHPSSRMKLEIAEVELSVPIRDVRAVGCCREGRGPVGQSDEQSVAAAAAGPGIEADQLHPLVDPQLGQAWQEPARIICTPHCMHIGASLWRTFGASATSRTIPPGLVMSLLGAFDARPRSS